MYDECIVKKSPIHLGKEPYELQKRTLCIIQKSTAEWIQECVMKALLERA